MPSEVNLPAKYPLTYEEEGSFEAQSYMPSTKPKQENKGMSFGQNDTFEQIMNNNDPNTEQKVEYSLSPYSPSKDEIPMASPNVMAYDDFEMIENQVNNEYGIQQYELPKIEYEDAPEMI